MRREELDIYFKEEYGRIYELNNEGRLETFKLKSFNGKVIYNFLKRKIPTSVSKEYFDITTPYGYGGPVFLEYPDEGSKKKLIEEFKKKFSNYCLENNIVSEFIRFHPLMETSILLEDYMEVIYNRNTICIDITSESEIWNTLTSNCRKNIRKALRNDVEIKILENNLENLEKFYEIYIKTMKQNNAADYYFFSREFFKNTMELLKEDLRIFAAYHKEKIISSALIIHRGGYMHYHFSGSDLEARDIAANNLLIYEACKWGVLNDKKQFHLGGGYLGNDDSLYRFKSSFTKKDPYKFYIGKKIHNPEIYNVLVEEIKKIKKVDNINYFPLYRV